MFGCMLMLFGGFVKVILIVLFGMIILIIGIFVVGFVFIILFIVIVGKLLGYFLRMLVVIGVICMLVYFVI